MSSSVQAYGKAWLNLYIQALQYLASGSPAQWCGAHKAPGMMDVANRRCEADGCHKVCCLRQGHC